MRTAIIQIYGFVTYAVGCLLVDYIIKHGMNIPLVAIAGASVVWMGRFAMRISDRFRPVQHEPEPPTELLGAPVREWARVRYLLLRHGWSTSTSMADFLEERLRERAL